MSLPDEPSLGPCPLPLLRDFRYFLPKCRLKLLFKAEYTDIPNLYEKSQFSMCMCVYTQACVSLCAGVSTCAYVCVCVRVYTCVCVCVYGTLQPASFKITGRKRNPLGLSFPSCEGVSPGLCLGSRYMALAKTHINPEINLG